MRLLWLSAESCQTGCGANTKSVTNSNQFLLICSGSRTTCQSSVRTNTSTITCTSESSSQTVIRPLTSLPLHSSSWGWKLLETKWQHAGPLNPSSITFITWPATAFLTSRPFWTVSVEFYLTGQYHICIVWSLLPDLIACSFFKFLIRPE